MCGERLEDDPEIRRRHNLVSEWAWLLDAKLQSAKNKTRCLGKSVIREARDGMEENRDADIIKVLLRSAYEPGRLDSSILT